MESWIAASEFVRNLALAAAAGVGAFLAWRKLGPETRTEKKVMPYCLITRQKNMCVK